MVYDQAQSRRLGQRTPVENSYVRMFSADEIPEAAWEGQLIYRNETQGLQIFNGNAWEDVVGGAAGVLTFIGPTPPVAQHVGDLWFDSSDDNRMYVAASVGADAIAGLEISHIDEIGQELFAICLRLLAKLSQDPLRKLQVFHFARLVHGVPPNVGAVSLAHYTCTRIVASLAVKLYSVALAPDQRTCWTLRGNVDILRAQSDGNHARRRGQHS